MNLPDEYWLRRGHTELVPCNNDVGCKQLYELSSDSMDFCEAAFYNFQRYTVSHTRDEPDLCYDGVPSARFKRGKTPVGGFFRFGALLYRVSVREMLDVIATTARP